MHIRYALITAALLLPLLGHAQLGGLMDRAKAKAKAKGQEMQRDDQAQAQTQSAAAADARAQGDVLFAISLADNAGGYEAREKGKLAQGALTELRAGGISGLSARGLKDRLKNRAEQQAANVAGETPEFGRQLTGVGENLYRGRRFKTAAGAFRRAVAIFEEKAPNDAAYPRAVAGLGLANLGLGRYSQADSLLRRSIALQDSINGDTALGAVAARNNLAVLQRELGRYTDAEATSARVLAATQGYAADRATPRAIALNNHAMLLQALGRDQEAERLLREAINTVPEGDLLGVQLLGNLALVTQSLGRYAAADSLYNLALARQRRRVGAQHPDVARLLNGQAALHLAMGNTGDVAALLEQALDIYRKRFGERHPATASTLHNLGSFYRTQGQYDKAEPALKQARDIRAELLGTQHPDLAATDEQLAVLNWKRGRSADATTGFRALNQARLEQVRRFFPAMSEHEKARFWARVRPGFELFGNYALDAGKADASLYADLYDIQLATKAILLSAGSQMRSRILASGNPQLVQQYRQWTDATTQLAYAYSLSKEELAEEALNLDSLERAANGLERVLSAASAEYAAAIGQTAPTVASVRTALAPTDAAVELVRLRKYDQAFGDEVRYAALVLLPGDKPVAAAVSEGGSALEKAQLTRYRRAIKNKAVPEGAYAAYWGWIAPLLQGSKDVYLSLDGVYHQVSLATLQAAANGPYLLQQTTLHNLVSTRDLPAMKAAKAPASKQVVLVGAPDFAAKLASTDRSTIAALPGTELEVNKIRTLVAAKGFAPQVFLKAQATEAVVKQQRRPRVLHVATHGYFLADVPPSDGGLVFGVQPEKAQENPLLRSGLLLTGADRTVQNVQRTNADPNTDDNGILTAYEALNLDLQGTELVVLSACETGLGDVQAGEGVYGLQRAFQLAGAQAVVISLWRVDDAATQELMTKFYTYWTAGRPLKTAFQAAQLELKAKYPQPYYWGAFQLIGG